MAISKIKTGSITDSAVNTDKLAPGSVGSTDLSPTAITGQTELSETAADTDFTIIYDTSAGALKKILRSNLKQAGPTISSISPTNANESDGATVTFTITGTGFTTGSSARLIGNLGKVQEFDTVTRSSTTSITATVAFSSLEQGQEPYDIQVTNGEGLASILTNQVNVDASPVYTTASGSLGSINVNSAGSFSVNATDPDSAGNVTFELQSGSLPPGYSITNTAADGGTAIISGTDSTTSTTTVFNFVLRAVDAASNTSSRSFSIQSKIPVSESFTSSGTFSVPAGITSVDVLVVGGGGGGGTQHGSGGGAGGLIFMPGYPVTPSGTVSVTVGCGGAGSVGYSHPNQGTTGQDSAFGTLTAKGGGGGSGDPRLPSPSRPGLPGGSGGGGSIVGQGIQPTQPGNSGAYGFGNPGGVATTTGPGTGSGGGGSGAVGSNAVSGTQGGPGGVGKAYTIADGTTSVYYAGGGGGGGHTNSPGNFGTGGQGGGGNGGDWTATASPECTAEQGKPGTANRGGGAGGAGSGLASGGTGGKGIVIVRY